jgi:sigma-54 dependent transcriptional regulator
MSTLRTPNPPASARTLVCEDRASRALAARIGQIAPSQATVLLIGETGTGKELVARAIHDASERPGPFVAVNCGAFAESLLEAELFGHEGDAFTGARGARRGWFEAAEGGTIFLDEIGELPLAAQVKLLRALQEREVVRLGAREPVAIDARVIAATNVDLAAAVAANRFREDLFYRLAVAVVRLPPLRDRPGDILPLARHFLARHGPARPLQLSRGAAERLLAHRWPGNVRELENVVHHAVLVCRGNEVRGEDLLLPHAEPNAEVAFEALESALLALYERNVPDLYRQIEEVIFRTAYHYCDRNQMQTARLLHVTRNVLRARLVDIGEITGSV